MTIPKEIRKFLLDNNLDLKRYSGSELFNFYLQAHEGIQFSSEVTDSWYNAMRSLLKIKLEQEFLDRLHELKTGDLNFGDFESAKQLAIYLETGVWK